MKERVYGLPPALHDRAQLLSALVASANDISEGYSLTRQVSRNRSAEELVPVENTNLAHVTWIVADGHVFTHVRRQGEREVTEAMEVNAVGSYPSTAQFMDEQEIELPRDSGMRGRKAPSSQRSLGDGLPSELRRR